MIINRTHAILGIGTAVATGAVALVYLANNDPAAMQKLGMDLPLPHWLGPVPPLESNFGATPLGLTYGAVALAIFIFAALLGARRGMKWLPVGSIQTWLKLHIWLTIFTVPLVVFHCGFHGGGPFTQFLLWLYAFVMLSGFWGLALQHVIPKLMQEYLPEEVIFEQIPYIRTQLVAQVEAVREELASEPVEAVAGHGEHGSSGTATVVASRGALRAILTFVDEVALPYLRKANAHGSALCDKDSSDNQFRVLRLQVPEAVQLSVGQVQDICDRKTAA